MNIPPSISLSHQELYGAMLLWTAQARQGKCLDPLAVEDQPVEEVAEGSAAYLWHLFGGDRDGALIVQGTAELTTGPERLSFANWHDLTKAYKRHRDA